VTQELLIQNQEHVNHTELLSNVEDYPDAGIFGIISFGQDPSNGERIWQIVPYYSDAVMYDEDYPEFLDRENVDGTAVDEAIEAVRQWIEIVKKARPDQISVHEPKTSAEIKPLEHDEPFYNWQGHEYRFEPTHGGDNREGVNAYDGADLVGSITWTDEGDFVYLRSAYVDPAYRGEGLFKELFTHMPVHKPVEGEWSYDSPLAGFFEKWNQRFAANDAYVELVQMLVQSLKGNRGDGEALKQMIGPGNVKWTQEEVNQAVDDAMFIYKQQQEEEERQRQEVFRQQWEEEDKHPHAEELEVRWGYNRETHEWWLVPTEGHVIHPDMMNAWKENWD